MSIHMRSQLCASRSLHCIALFSSLTVLALLFLAVLIRPQSLKLGSRALTTAKKLQGRSQALALRLPARVLPRTTIVVAGAVLSASVSLLLKESALCQDAMLLAAAVRVSPRLQPVRGFRD